MSVTGAGIPFTPVLRNVKGSELNYTELDSNISTMNSHIENHTHSEIGGLSLTNDTTTDATYYPIISTDTTGTAAKVSSTKLQYNPSTGTLYSTIFNSSSDIRLKENIKELSYGLNEVMVMTSKSFTFIEGGVESIGFIAQDLKEIIPEVISENKEGVLGVNYGALVAVLVNAIKELKAEIDILKGN